MDIGFLADLRNPPPWQRPWARHYAEQLELIEEADRRGAAAIFIAEHHLTPDGYIPQPLTFAAAVAARTRSMRVGTAVLVAPFRHPLHIAEQAAVVDVLSDGRLELGLGAAYAPAEFAAFGVERRERFRLLDAAAVEVRRLLHEVVTPRPIQDDVPIWCGYFGVGARRAGLMGFGLLSLVRTCLEPYREGLAAGGHDPDSARMSGPLDLLVSDDPERARSILQPHIEYQAAEYASYQRSVAEAEGRAPYLGGSALVENYRVLTPDDAITFIRRVTEGLPVRYVFPWLSVGGMPRELVLEHINLTMTKVAPALR